MRKTPPLNKVLPNPGLTAFSVVENDYRLGINMAQYARTLLEAERAEQKESDDSVQHIHDKNPPKVEDKIEKVKELGPAHDEKIEAPKGAKKLDVDKESTHKDLKLSGMIPTKFKRAKDESVESIEDFNETEMEELKESEDPAEPKKDSMRDQEAKRKQQVSDTWANRRKRWDAWKRDNPKPIRPNRFPKPDNR